MIYAKKTGRHVQEGRLRFTVAAVVATTAIILGYGLAMATPSTFLELDGNVIKDGGGTVDWANSGTLTTTGGTYSRAGSGGIFDGGQFNGNTTPPTAPSKTAGAIADGTIADAAFKVDPLSVDVTSCGTGDPTVYTGAGSETNGDLLSSDTFGTGSTPNKDDLSNVYAVAHVNGATNEVFFGAERVINNGDSHIDFEFLQSVVTIPDACSGSFSGHRTQGDFLLSVDFTNGGTLGGTTLYKWICDASENVAHDGDVCDPALHGKSAPHYMEKGSTAITITVNGTGNIGCGGWVCRNPDGTPTTTIAQNELMEGGIDLAQLGFNGCVSTFLPHTRSSQSFTATLKDFEIIPFNTCKTPSIATQVKKVSDDSNVSAPIQTGVAVYDTATLSNATPDAGGTVTYRLYTDSSCTTLSTNPTLGATAAAGATVTVTNGVVPPSSSVGATGSVSFTNGGTWYFQATYSGDARNQVPAGGKKSPCTSETVVVKNNPTVATIIVPSGPVSIGTDAHDTAQISGATANAGGTISYTLYSNDDCTGILADLTPVNNTVVNGAAPDSKAYTFNNAGTFYFYAVYSGDANNTGPVNSGCAAEPFTVNPNTPSVATIIVPSGPVSIGTDAHDTAQISGATANAGGTISYTLYSNDDCTGILADLTPVNNTVVNGAAPDSKAYTFNNAGTFYFYAVYSGDANNTGPVNSGCAAEPFTVNPNTPSVATIIVPSGPVSIGTDAHDTAQISGATANAGGTISYTLYSNDDCTGILADLTPVNNTVVNGAAPDSKAYTFNNAGTFYFYAVYSGDANNTGPVNSGCAAEPFTVNPNTPAPHSTPLVQIKDTFTVDGFTADATGNVLVGLYTSSDCTTGQVGSNASFPVSAAVGGVLTDSTTFVGVTAGTYYFKISYAGDSNNTGFSSCAEDVGVTITSLP